MPAPANCCTSACSDIEIINVPGIEGDAGAAGADGINAFAPLTGNFTVPVIGDSDTALVESSAWASVGQIVYMEDAGYFEVVSLPSTASMELEYLDYTGNSHAGEVIGSGNLVSPGGVTGPGGLAGAGSPEGSVTGSPGTTYLNTTDEGFWVKKTGTQTNTGWIQLISCLLLFLGFNLPVFGQSLVRNQYTTNSSATVLTLTTNIARSVATNDSVALTTMTNVALVSITNRYPAITNIANFAATNTLGSYFTNLSSYVITNTQASYLTNLARNVATSSVAALTLASGGSATMSTGTVTVATSSSTNLFNAWSYNVSFGSVGFETNSNWVVTNAGNYIISFGSHLGGSNGDAIRGMIFTNGVECVLSAVAFTATASVLSETGFKQFVVALPANCRVSFRVSNSAASNTTLQNSCLNIRGAN